MKLSVAALFLATSVTLLAAIVPAQTTHRKTSRSTPAEPRDGTVKICQGLPIPPGYTITGYLTTSACPHGAYLIKKQPNSDPASSVATSVAPNKKESSEPQRSVPVKKKADRETQRSAAVNNSGARAAVGTTAAASRPRRVGTTEPENEAPTLQGVDPPPAPTAPTLGSFGRSTSASKPAEPTANQVAAGPEEVGEGEVVRVDTALVTVPVSVLDRQGRFVPNLKKEDFSVFENGVEQSITYFEPTEKPFTVALVLDTSASTHFHLSEIKEAAIAFASQLRPQDRVLVVSFNDQVLLLTEATNDLGVVGTVIHQYASTGSSTRLYDAIDLVIKERLNKIKGRKAIVLFTDGVDTSSYMATYESTMGEVEELDALIYPIQYDTSDYVSAMQGGTGTVTIVTSGSNWPFPSSRSSSQVIYSGPTNGGISLPGTSKADYERADKYLHELAEKTGARLYQANDTTQLAQAFTRIAEELRRQYSIGYYPQTSTDTSDERRQIRVRVRKPNLAVRARASYKRASSTTPVQ